MIDRIEKLITEAKRGKTGSRRTAKGHYPRGRFNYVNYDNDPNPDVLVLGDWRNPNTKNVLKAGINLNYLSKDQLLKLRKIVDRLFSNKSLRSRYRFLRNKAPDIARYYRTYDTKFIRSWQPQDLSGYKPNEPATVEPDRKDQAIKARAKPEPDVVDTGRKAWQLKRQLYNPDTGRRNAPEQAKGRGLAAAKRAKIDRYRQQRRALQDLDKDLELQRTMAQLEKPDEPDLPDEPDFMDEPTPDIDLPDEPVQDRYALDEPEEPEEPEVNWPNEDQMWESKDYSYSPSIGYVWNSPQAYRRYHRPDNFRGSKKDLLAVLDINTGEVIVDDVTNHAVMLYEAGWDYDHVVRMSVRGSKLLVESDCEEDLVRRVLSASDMGSIIEACTARRRIKDI